MLELGYTVLKILQAKAVLAGYWEVEGVSPGNRSSMKGMKIISPSLS